MSTGNRVVPGKKDTNIRGKADDPSGATSSSNESTVEDVRLADFKRYVHNSFCYHPIALENATVISQEKKEAYQVDIYSLREERSMVWKERAYQNESYPAEAVSLFDDRFDIPETVLKSKHAIECDLTRSFNKLVCANCEGLGRTKCQLCMGTGTNLMSAVSRRCNVCGGTGYNSCSRCKQSGSILTYAHMSVTWRTVHSTSYYQNTCIPEKCINKAGHKQIVFNVDESWSKDKPLDQFASRERARQLIENSSKVPFWSQLEEHYDKVHMSKVNENVEIRRMLMTIQKLDIIETDYSLEAYVNKRESRKGEHTFTFLQYGADKNGLPEIYDVDYPLAVCGCFGPGCACQSCTCTIV